MAGRLYRMVAACLAVSTSVGPGMTVRIGLAASIARTDADIEVVEPPDLAQAFAVALVVAGDHHAAVQAHLECRMDAGEVLHAPAVLPYEIANVLARLRIDGARTAEDIGDTCPAPVRPAPRRSRPRSCVAIARGVTSGDQLGLHSTGGTARNPAEPWTAISPATLRTSAYPSSS